MGGRREATRVERGLIFRLACADLWHDWILSACMLFALGSVMAPLMLMFGLKFGTIETLRVRLIQDPANREIRPLSTVSRPVGWFAAMRQRDEVGFVVPTTRQIAATVSIKSAEGVQVAVDLIPTDTGDRLLLENQIPIPTHREVVLTAIAAQSLNVRTGDLVTLIATRSSRRESQRASVEMRVVGILPIRASGLKAVYTRLECLESVEAYKDGFAASDFGWEGSLPIAEPEYDGAIAIVSERLPEDKKLRLVVNTGFSTVAELEPEKVKAVTGWSLMQNFFVYWLQCGSVAVRTDSVAALREQLRGTQAEVLPWVRPLEVAVLGSDESSPIKCRIQGLSVSKESAERLGIQPIPPWGEDVEDFLRIMLPSDNAATQDRLSIISGERDLTVPVKVAEIPSRNGSCLVPYQLAGILRLAKSRPLNFDQQSGQVLLERRNYSGFRMYARTIDDVEPLRLVLMEEGINVHTEVQRIAEVTELDRHLTRIFWLIAAVGLTGALAALIASLYASIERKRRELGVLKLIGLTGSHLTRFPVYQSLICVTGSFLLAFLFFHGIATSINFLFKSHLQPGESFCRLPNSIVCTVFFCALAVGFLAAILAVVRVTKASAADALRQE
jgi:putative ABC transport system permease protein